MAIAVHTSRRDHAPRPPWMRRQPPDHDTLLALLLVGLVIVSVGTLVLTAPVFTVTVPRSLIGVTRRSIETRPRDGAVPVATATPGVGIKQPVSEPSESPAEAVATEVGASAVALAIGGRARIVNTGGVGVVLHAAPQAGARRPAGSTKGEPSRSWRSPVRSGRECKQMQRSLVGCPSASSRRWTSATLACVDIVGPGDRTIRAEAVHRPVVALTPFRLP